MILISSPLEVISIKGYISSSIYVRDSEPAYLLLTYHTTSFDFLSMNIVNMSPFLMLVNLVLRYDGRIPNIFPL